MNVSRGAALLTLMVALVIILAFGSYRALSQDEAGPLIPASAPSSSHSPN